MKLFLTPILFGTLLLPAARLDSHLLPQTKDTSDHLRRSLAGNTPQSTPEPAPANEQYLAESEYFTLSDEKTALPILGPFQNGSS